MPGSMSGASTRPDDNYNNHKYCKMPLSASIWLICFKASGNGEDSVPKKVDKAMDTEVQYANTGN